MPFIVRWPARVKPGVSDALVCQVDLLRVARGADRSRRSPRGDGPGQPRRAAGAARASRGRAASDLVQQAGGLALREGQWKYIEPSNRREDERADQHGARQRPEPQLYDLASDPGERHNLAAKDPKRTAAMAARLAAAAAAPAATAGGRGGAARR